jgi:hypothetical protein
MSQTRRRSGALERIQGILAASGFEALPDSLARHPVFGRFCGSEGDIVVITVFVPGGRKQVVDDQHCMWVPVGLRLLEAAVEAEAGVRPATRPPT